jgi:uncharacterized repeat protein (TIGR03803 family)
MLKRAAVLSVAALALSAGGASASSFTVLKTFCQQTVCHDGNTPSGPLLVDAQGDLFGVTVVGGTHNRGEVYELQHTDSGYVFRRAYEFCLKSGCADGWRPYGGLIMDAAGNLYGTTSLGGAFGGGIVYEISPGAEPFQAWAFTKLHDFCVAANCTDGRKPMAGLTYQGAASGALYDGLSPLFGTTSLGGANAKGAAFKLSFVGGRPKPKETVLYSFCAQTNCADGLTPSAPLTADADGNLYGTTNYGGAFGASYTGGVVFELSPQRKRYTYTVLHSFCAETNCADGNLPNVGGVTLDSGGNLYGGTLLPSAGKLFELTPNGTVSTLNVIYSFCPTPSCTDGYGPNGPLLVDASGDITGTTADGGTAANPAGTIFKLHGATESVLYSFCGNCADGANPLAVTADGAGNLFGATFTSTNTGQGGTVFELTP